MKKLSSVFTAVVLLFSVSSFAKVDMCQNLFNDPSHLGQLRPGYSLASESVRASLQSGYRSIEEALTAMSPHTVTLDYREADNALLLSMTDLSVQVSIMDGVANVPQSFQLAQQYKMSAMPLHRNGTAPFIVYYHAEVDRATGLKRHYFKVFSHLIMAHSFVMTHVFSDPE